MTHKEFCKKLLSIRSDIKEIISIYKSRDSFMIVKTKENNLHKVKAYHLYRNKPLEINSATDKLSFIRNKIKNLYPNLEILSYYCTNKRIKLIIKDELGIKYDKRYDSLMAGEGLRNSAIDKTEWFVKKSNKIHKGKYDYSKVIYKSTHKKVIITCSKHGDFKQEPNQHLVNKRGCPYCAKEISGNKWYYKNPKEISYCYFVKLKSNNEEFYKIGVAKDIDNRFKKFKKDGFHIEIIGIAKDIAENIIKNEQNLLNKYKSYTYKPITDFVGHTECFKF